MGDEQDLVRRCQRGDEDAFGELVDNYKVLVFSMIYRIVGRGADSEDLAQEVFLRVYRGISQFRGESKISTWIYQIAHRVCTSALRHPRRQYGHVSFDDPHQDSAKGDRLGGDADLAASRFEERDALDRLLDALPPNYRSALVLYYLHDRKYGEIAEIMELPMGSVKTYLHRAKKALRQQILEDGDA